MYVNNEPVCIFYHEDKSHLRGGLVITWLQGRWFDPTRVHLRRLIEQNFSKKCLCSPSSDGASGLWMFAPNKISLL